MPARKIGYARVSTKDQNLDRQIEILKAEGIDERDIYVEKESGKSLERPVYRTIVDHILREGDLLVVTELKRFGRNYVEIYEEWFKITKIVKAYIKVTSIPILNTAQSQELIGQVIADVVLALFAYIAQEDLEERHELQRQGIEAARKAGKHLGRPKIQYPEEWDLWFGKWQDGEITATEAMKQLNLKKDTFYRLIKKWTDLSRK